MMRVFPVTNAPVAIDDDGFGRRTVGLDADSGDEVERLELSAELVEHSGFVSALGERVARVAAVRHASYVQLRRIDRPSADRLVLVSEHTPGWRLSELLASSRAAGIPVDITVVIALLRQLLPAVSLYGRHNRDAAIGTLAVERLIVTPQGRLVIAEHAFGPAIEKLNLGREKLWRQLRVAAPPSAGLPRINQRADANAVGVVALSLLLGRVLDAEEFPSRAGALIEGLEEFHDGLASPLSAPFAAWLTRALQLDAGTAFQSPSEAQLAFENVLASDRSYVTTGANVEGWLAKLGALGVLVGPAGAGPSQNPRLSQDSSEGPPLGGPTHAPKAPLFAMGAAIVALVAVVGWLLTTRDTGAMRAGEGELAVQSRPPGARVTVDGEERGVTPLTVRLNSGAHVLEVRVGDSEPRVIPLTIQAGMQTSQYIELQDVRATGTLEIRSEPAGARVLIDGQPRGTTPATVRDLLAGEHTVVVEAGGRKATQTVTIEAGSTAQIVVPLPRR